MAKILIVDDDADVLDAARLVLESQGHAVSVASTRDEGMEAVSAFAPDLLILDVMMEQPDDGLAMAQTLRHRGVKVPILMLTSIGKVTGMSYDKDDELVPVDDFQEKPVAPSVLLDKVDRLLAGKER